jgi:hypothetical protein
VYTYYCTVLCLGVRRKETGWKTDWKVYSKELYKTFIPTDDDLSQPRGYVLMEAEEDGEVSNSMQLAVHGEKRIIVEFDTDDLFLEPALRGFHVTMEYLPSSIKPQVNKSTTQWVDIKEIISKREVVVTKNGQDAEEKFLSLMEEFQKKSYKNGAVIRWAFKAYQHVSVMLGLQALPGSLAFIKSKAQFCMDSTPSILLSMVPLLMPPSNTALVLGPPPTLFSPTPDATLSNLMANPTKALKGQSFLKEVLYYRDLPIIIASQ